MKVFISWSGERSQALALALREWLPMVLHYVEPWVSRADIEAGDRWAVEVARELDTTSFGIICITRENINSPWILFESGALAKSIERGRVVPLLLDIDFKDIAGPLSQFQAKKVDIDGLKETIEAINNSVDVKLPESRFQGLFTALWPGLDEKIKAIPTSSSPTKIHRPQGEVLEELVSSVRGLDLRFREAGDIENRSLRRRRRFHPMMIEELIHSVDLSGDDPLRLMIITGFIKEDMPWFYDISVELYRAMAQGSPRRISFAMNRLMKVANLIRRGPFSEMYSEKESYFVLREVHRFIDEFSSSSRVEQSLKVEKTSTSEAKKSAE